MTDVLLTNVTSHFLGTLFRDDTHVDVLAEFLVAIVTRVRGTTYVANITLTYYRVDVGNL